MATWTSAELADAVLRKLKVVPAGQSASAEDILVVTNGWNSVYEQLANLNLAPFDQEEIPREFQLPIVKYLAGEVYDEFGISGPSETTAINQARAGWNQILEQASTPRTSARIRQHYF